MAAPGLCKPRRAWASSFFFYFLLLLFLAKLANLQKKAKKRSPYKSSFEEKSLSPGVNRTILDFRAF